MAGGPGNQFFQYAFGQSLSKKTGIPVLYNITWFKNRRLYNNPSASTQHVYYILKLYKTTVNVATTIQCREVKELVTQTSRYPGTISDILNIKDNLISHYINYNKQAGVYNPELFNLKGDFYIIGLYQSEKYFKEYRADLLKDFTLDIPLDDKNISMLLHIKSTQAVSLHIRRGDYVKLGWQLPMSYYEDAIRYIKSKIKNPYFYIFSNDCEYVRNNLKIDSPAAIVDINPPNKGYYDLELMRNCKHNIIANSTFSWWGAWLNNNPEKIVIAPYPWVVKGDNFKDIVPESWVKIEHS